MENKKYIIFVDSYGRINKFPRNKEVLKKLRKRNVNSVLPEVKEVLDRLLDRDISNIVIKPVNISLELQVRKSTILRALQILIQEGILLKNDKNFVTNKNNKK